MTLISNNTYTDIEVPTLRYQSASISEPDIEVPDVDIDVFFGNHDIEYGYVDIEVTVFNIKKNVDIMIFNIDVNVDIGGGKVPDGTSDGILRTLGCTVTA